MARDGKGKGSSLQVLTPNLGNDVKCDKSGQMPTLVSATEAKNFKAGETVAWACTKM